MGSFRVTKPSLILSFSTILELCAHFLYNNFDLLLNPAMFNQVWMLHVLTVSQPQSCQFCAYVFYWYEFGDTHAISSSRCASVVEQLVGWYCGTTRESNPWPLKSRAVTETTLTLRSCGPPPYYLDNIVFLSENELSVGGIRQEFTDLTMFWREVRIYDPMRGSGVGKTYNNRELLKCASWSNRSHRDYMDLPRLEWVPHSVVLTWVYPR